MAAGRVDAPTGQHRRARGAVAALFLTNGALFANLLPRYPEIKADLALSNTGYGLAIAAFSAGALTAGLTAAALIRRFRSARVAVVGTVVLAVFVLAAGLAGTPLLLGAALFVAGAADAVTDVAQNAHGLQVQRAYGRSIINSFHAVWSIGALLGGSMGAAAIALDISRGVHLAIAAVMFSAVVLGVAPFLLPGPERDRRPTAPAADRPAGVGVYATLAALVGIAIAGAVIEDAGSSWSVLYLRDSLDAAPVVAVLGYLALSGGMLVGRLTGDRMVDRFGERAVVRAGASTITVGMGCALAFPTVPGVIGGFAAAGLGVATLVPAAMHGADQLPGIRAGTGLMAVTWLMRLGFLASPPVVGAIADATSLRVGLLGMPVAGLAAATLAGVLNGRRRTPRS